MLFRDFSLGFSSSFVGSVSMDGGVSLCFLRNEANLFRLRGKLLVLFGGGSGHSKKKSLYLKIKTASSLKCKWQLPRRKQK